MLCKQAKPSQANQGFTLVELSIVIVIIGLIIAGVTAGSSLVKSARLSRTVTEVNQIIMATDVFQMQYNCLPGDCKNASSYWATANGNGNKLIADIRIIDTESLPAWQQLGSGFANLIPGSYSGSGGASIGVNVPQSAYSSSSTYYFYSDNLWSNYAMGNSMVLCGAKSEGWDDYKVLVNDAYAIDNKIDDGIPYTGKVMSYNATAANCVASPLSATPNHKTSKYLIGNGTLCAVHFAVTRYFFK